MSVLRPGARHEDSAAAPAQAEAPMSDLAYTLYSQAFQQISLLAIAAAGGALVLIQAGLFKVRPWTAVGAAVILALAALVSVMGSMELARGAADGKPIRKSLKVIQVVAFFLVGIGTGMLVMGLIRNAGL